MDPTTTALLSSWNLDGTLLCVLFAVAAVYVRGWIRLNLEMPHKYGAGRVAAFLAGILTILLALASALDALGGFLLQAHMIQHLLLLMVAPPLLLIGQPVLPLLRGLPQFVFKNALGPFLGWGELKSLGRAIIHPIVCWVVLAVVIVFWHLPRFYQLALHSTTWHEVEHACFFGSAILFWWPVIGVWPSRSVWPTWAMIPYLVCADFINTALSAALSFSHHVIYPTYQAAPRLWAISALHDQAAAGGIMWVPGSIAFLVPAVALGMRTLEPAQRFVAAPIQRRPVLRPATKETWDLLRMPVARQILRHRRLLQAIMFVTALAVAADGFFGPQVAPLNLAGVLPWTYWRGFAVIALLFAGNLFCMACPFTLARDFARRFAPPRLQWPRQLRSKWIAVALLATFLWAYEVFRLWDSPRATAWIIAVYFGAVVLVDVSFKGASFCKYVCPIGQFHFVNSLISPLEVKVREPAICTTCSTHDCIRGNERRRGCELHLFQPTKLGNFDCTFCLDCVTACPTENVGILRVIPGESLLEQRRASGVGKLNQRADVAALALILVFGAFINAAAMTDPVMMWMHRLHASFFVFNTIFYVAGLFVVPAILAVACGWLCKLWAGSASPVRELACAFALAMVPLGFAMWTAHFEGHLISGWYTLAEPAARILSIASPTISHKWIATIPIQLMLLDLGLLVTLYATWRLAKRVAAGRAALGAMSPWALLAVSLYCVGVWTVFQPMQMRGMVMP
jgi:cytochrome c oxidase assembly factor CtaG/polyferredoxin